MAPSVQDLPIREAQSSNGTSQDQPASTEGNIDILPHLTAWLETIHSKISAFWIGADWRAWARYELYLYLEQKLADTHLIYHTFNDIWDDEDVIDIFMEPRGGEDLKNIAIVLRCERVNENCGSFEQFREDMDEDIERIRGLGSVDGMYEGTRLFVVGFSGPVMSDDAEWKCRPVPRHFEAEEVNGWVYEMELEGKD